MTTLAPILQTYFTDRLIGQRQASPHTIAGYRDTFRLLLGFATTRTGKPPSDLDLADIDADLVSAFLDHLERDRGNSVRTRNTRLAGIHSLFAYAALRHPDHAATIQRVLAIPAKRFQPNTITYLTTEETDALLAACDRDSWTGRRDHAALLLTVQTGLRISELIALTVADLHLGRGANVHCYGKGRKHRHTPLSPDDRRGPAGLAGRTPRRTRGPAVSHPNRPTAQPRRDRTPNHPLHQSRSRVVPVAARQARHRPHPAPHRRDGAAPRRHRPHRHRAVARPRAHLHHRDLPALRHEPQATRPRRHRTGTHPTGPLPPTRPAPRIPRRSLIMPTPTDRTGCVTTDPNQRSA